MTEEKMREFLRQPKYFMWADQVEEIIAALREPGEAKEPSDRCICGATLSEHKCPGRTWKELYRPLDLTLPPSPPPAAEPSEAHPGMATLAEIEAWEKRQPPAEQAAPSGEDVHTEHCCRHRCKYGYSEDCPVVRGEKPQSFPCEDCYDEIREEELQSELTTLRAEIERLTCDGVFFPTEAEATFRLLLYTDPAEALSAFLRATGGAYEGDCKVCGGSGSLIGDPECDFCAGRGRVAVYSEESSDAVADCPRCDRTPCPTCHGTGGPPARALLEVAADWYSDHGCEMEASVLRSITSSEKVS